MSKARKFIETQRKIVFSRFRPSHSLLFIFAPSARRLGWRKEKKKAHETAGQSKSKPDGAPFRTTGTKRPSNQQSNIDKLSTRGKEKQREGRMSKSMCVHVRMREYNCAKQQELRKTEVRGSARAGQFKGSRIEKGKGQ